MLQGRGQFDFSSGDEIAGTVDIAIEKCVEREGKGASVRNFSKYPCK